MAMLKVTGLKKYFTSSRTNPFAKGSVIKAVDGVSFSVPEGATLGLVGESGSGKTTAARCVMRLTEPTAGGVEINGTDVLALKKKQLREFRKNMQIVFQDPLASLDPRMTVGGIIGEPLKIHTKLSRTQREARVAKLLEDTGLPAEYANRYPHEFSGGQRQRVCIARAIALNPKLLVLDEPVSSLDVSIQGQVLNLLQELRRKMGLTYLFVAHDLAVVKYMSDSVAVMYLGRIAEENEVGRLYAKPLHPYTAGLLASVPDVNSGEQKFTPLKGETPSQENTPAGCPFYSRCPQSMPVCEHTPPAMREIDGGRVACHLY